MNKAPDTADRTFARAQWDQQASAHDVRLAKIHNVLQHTKGGKKGYAARDFPAGYHTLEVDGTVFEGQRNPRDRLDRVPLDFAGKSVLDIGCNQGGMLYAIRDRVKWAVGVDFDYKMINACNALRNHLGGSEHLDFYVFDIDRDPHDLLRDFLPEDRVDVVFLLSVCMWVDRWKPLIAFCSRIAETMVFESNGSEKVQENQLRHLERCYSSVTFLGGKKPDDARKLRNRQLWLASGPVPAQ